MSHALVDEETELLGDKHLADADRDRALRADLRAGIRIGDGCGILQPEEIERRESVRHANRVRHIVLHVTVDADLEVGSGRFPHPEPFDDPVDLSQGKRAIPDVSHTFRRHEIDVEFHLREARRDGFLRHFARLRDR